MKRYFDDDDNDDDDDDDDSVFVWDSFVEWVLLKDTNDCVYVNLNTSL